LNIAAYHIYGTLYQEVIKMIDNRPKVHQYKKFPPEGLFQEQATLPEEIHIDAAQTPAPPPPPPVDAPVHVKSVQAQALPAPGLGGLGGLLGSLGGGLGGGLGGILPVVLVVSALQKGRGLPFGAQPKVAARQQSLPVIPVEAEATPLKAATAAHKPAHEKQSRQKTGAIAEEHSPPTPAPKSEPKTGLKQRTQLRTEKRPAEAAKTTTPDPAPMPSPRQAAPARPAPKPAEIKNLLSDLAGYLPGTGSSSVSKISKIIGIADEIKSIDNSPGIFAAAQNDDPLNRHIGLLNVLGRNLPFAGASNLGKASQVLSIVNTLRSNNGPNIGNMAGMIQNMMGPMSPMSPQQSSPQEMKNITPAQADGIKDTVNRLLSGMDDRQKNDLLDKAKDFLGKR
jgi:hypothetical protein